MLHTGPRASIHPHLVSGRELAVLMSKAHLILRSIQLKIGHDLLMQVRDCVITLCYNTEIIVFLPPAFSLPSLHPLTLSSTLSLLPFLPSPLSPSLFLFSSPIHLPLSLSLPPSFPHVPPLSLSFIMAGIPQAADTGLFCQSIQ